MVAARKGSFSTVFSTVSALGSERVERAVVPVLVAEQLQFVIPVCSGAAWRKADTRRAEREQEKEKEEGKAGRERRRSHPHPNLQPHPRPHLLRY